MTGNIPAGTVTVTVTKGTSPGEEVAHGHWKMDFQLAGKPCLWEHLQD